MSNTYLFYRHGAQGITVEPNREMARYHRHKRPRDKLIEAAVSTDGKPSITFHHFEQPALSTTDKEQVISLAKTGKHKLLYSELVPAVSPMDIASLCDGQRVDVLSIDIEGLQLPVIKGLFAAGIRPKFICCETVNYDGSDTVTRDLEVPGFFRDNGYIVVGDTVINTIFAEPGALSYRVV